MCRKIVCCQSVYVLRSIFMTFDLQISKYVEFPSRFRMIIVRQWIGGFRFFVTSVTLTFNDIS